MISALSYLLLHLNLNLKGYIAIVTIVTFEYQIPKVLYYDYDNDNRYHEKFFIYIPTRN